MNWEKVGREVVFWGGRGEEGSWLEVAFNDFVIQITNMPQSRIGKLYLAVSVASIIIMTQNVTITT